MITATVTIIHNGSSFTYIAIGKDIGEISEAAEEIAGGEPYGLTIMVH